MPNLKKEIRDVVNVNYMRIECKKLREAYSKAIEENKKLEEFDFDYVGKSIRERGHLTPLELLYIICWKAPSNVGSRGRAVNEVFRYFQDNGIECLNKIESITKEAIDLANKGMVEESIKNLIKLHGVQTRVASAILTFYNPKKFGVVDVNAWKSLYHERKTDFQPEDYVKYLKDIQELAKQCTLTPRAVDLALWYISSK
jgi:hypothetical protein